MQVELNLEASQSLSLEGLRNEIARLVQVARKEAKLQVDDKTTAELYSTDEFVIAAAKVHADYIKQECQLTQFTISTGDKDSVVVQDAQLDFVPAKWHTPVGWSTNQRTGMKDLFYKGGEYPHYWAAIYNMTKGAEYANSK